MAGVEKDARQIEWQNYQEMALKKFKCPYSGLPLTKHGEGIQGTMSCSVCDCWGWMLP